LFKIGLTSIELYYLEFFLIFYAFVPFKVALDQYYCYSTTLSGLKGFLTMGAEGLPSTLSALLISEFISINSGGLS